MISNNETNLLNTILFKAIEDSDVSQLSAVCKHKDCNLNCYDSEGITPLIKAIEKSDIQIINLLLESGANVNNQAQNGLLPIQFASWNLGILKILIDNGADINALMPFTESSILHLASFEGNIKAITLLLELGADIEARNNDGWTPLHLATCNDNLGAITALLDSGADIEARNNDGYAPLHLARSKEAVTALLELGANIEAKFYKGSTALHLAVMNDDSQMVCLLLKNKADVNAVNDRGFIPLHYAAINGNIEIINTLLTYGANKDCINEEGRTTLNYLAESPFDLTGVHLPNLKDHQMHRVLWNVFSVESVRTLLKKKDPIACAPGGLSNEAVEFYYRLLNSYKEKDEIRKVDECLSVIDALLIKLRAITYGAAGRIKLVYPKINESVIIETGGAKHSFYGILDHYKKNRFLLRLIDRGRFGTLIEPNSSYVYPETGIIFSSKKAKSILTMLSESQNTDVHNSENILFNKIPQLSKKSFDYNYIKKGFGEGHATRDCYMSNFRSLIFSEMIHSLGLLCGRVVYRGFIIHTLMKALNDFQSYFKLSDDDEIIQACWDVIEKRQEKHRCSLLDILSSSEENKTIETKTLVTR